MREYLVSIGLAKSIAECELDDMIGTGGRLSEHHNCRRYERVSELNGVGCEAVNARA